MSRTLSLGRYAGSRGVENSENAGKGGAKPFYPFASGVDYTFPSAKKALSGRILPAFDPSFSSADEAYKTSFIPYRSRDEIDKTTGFQAFTNWFVSLQLQAFLGKTMVTYVSPRMLSATGASRDECIDPVAECFFYCKDQVKQGNTEFDRYVKTPQGSKDDPPFKMPRDVMMFNFYHLDPQDNQWKVTLPIMSRVGFEHILNVLDSYRNPEAQPRDPEWPSLLLGDVTHPQTGLRASTCMAPLGMGGNPVNTMRFTDSHTPNSLRGAEVMPVGPEVLAQRYDITGDGLVTIPTQQQIVDFMLNDPVYPREIVKTVCGEFADVTDGGTQRSGNPGEYKDTHEDLVPQSSPPPPQAPLAPQPPPAPKADSRKFWVVKDGHTIGQRQTVDAILGLTGVSVVMPEDQSSGWKSPEEYGIVKAPEAPQPPPPSAGPPAPPEPPKAPAASAVKTEATTESPQATGGLPSTAKDPNKAERLKELEAKIEDGSITDAELQEYGDLCVG